MSILPEDPRTRRAFLSSIKHQLRTPLNAIIGYSEMLLEDVRLKDPANIGDDLDRIAQTGYRLLKIVNNIFDPDQIDIRTNHELEDFRNHVHYEMRNPLNIVIGYSEIALEKCEHISDHKAAADLKRIDKSAQQLLDYIDDIVHVARINLSEPESQPKDEMSESMTAVSVIVEDVVMTLRNLETQVTNAPFNGNILVVEDSLDNLEILVRQLERQGHHAIGVSDGQSALEILNTQKFDLMILDLIMPNTNGYEVLKQVRTRQILDDMQIIVLSALDDVDSMLRGIALGAQDYITKPFNPAILRARINALLEKKRMRDLEVAFINNVNKVTQAAAAVESGNFEPESLINVAQRTDELGRLARVFQNMAYEVIARERRLQEELKELKIRIDYEKEEEQVAQIVETDYFQELQHKVKELRTTFQDG